MAIELAEAFVEFRLDDQKLRAGLAGMDGILSRLSRSFDEAITKAEQLNRQVAGAGESLGGGTSRPRIRGLMPSGTLAAIEGRLRGLESFGLRGGTETVAVAPGEVGKAIDPSSMSCGADLEMALDDLDLSDKLDRILEAVGGAGPAAPASSGGTSAGASMVIGGSAPAVPVAASPSPRFSTLAEPPALSAVGDRPRIPSEAWRTGDRLSALLDRLGGAIRSRSPDESSGGTSTLDDALHRAAGERGIGASPNRLFSGTDAFRAAENGLLSEAGPGITTVPATGAPDALAADRGFVPLAAGGPSSGGSFPTAASEASADVQSIMRTVAGELLDAVSEEVGAGSDRGAVLPQSEPLARRASLESAPAIMTAAPEPRRPESEQLRMLKELMRLGAQTKSSVEALGGRPAVVAAG